jgi:hypothetical protein
MRPKIEGSGRVTVSKSALKEIPNWDQERPAFCFRYLQGGYDTQVLTSDQATQFLDRLRRLSQLSWIDLYGSGRHGMGCEKIANLRVGLPRALSPDTTILAFRCFGLMPMLGFRRFHVFHLVWLDPNGECYNH